MSNFKVQRIRSCTQCGTVLSLKCKACISHPDRKPRVIEVYDWPPILATCPSGQCVQIQCQLPGCTGTMWRNRTHTRGGKMRSQAMYHTKACNMKALAAARDTRTFVNCGWRECKTKVLRTQSQLKTLKSAYCRQDHYFLEMRASIHDAKEAKLLIKEGTDGRSLLECLKCRDITDHEKTGRYFSKCLKCTSVRSDKPAVLTHHDSYFAGVK